MQKAAAVIVSEVRDRLANRGDYMRAGDSMLEGLWRTRTR